MKAPGLLLAMAKERHSFFKDGKANLAIAAFVSGRDRARH
jgi:hypothetical protein